MGDGGEGGASRACVLWFKIDKVRNHLTGLCPKITEGL